MTESRVEFSKFGTRFEFSKFGTREWEVQLWSMVYAANSDNDSGENAEYCAICADEAVLELRKRL